jgi:AraC-like DNA-binding protein/quercetin dioxygenase-like cupin family protein
MSARAHHPHDSTGSAVETVRGQARRTVFFGTFRDDFPDPRFRFNIVFIERTEPFPLHGHEYDELVVVLDGHATHRTDFGDYPLQPGEVFVISPGVRHGLADIHNLRLCLMMFDPRQLFRREHRLAELPGFHGLFSLPTATCAGFTQRLRLDPQQLLRVVNLVSNLKEEFDRRAPGHEVMVRGLFLCLVTYLTRLHGQPRPATVGPASRFAPVIARLERDWTEPVRVSELARLVNLSGSQFRRAFKQAFNVAPKHFQLQLRIQAACKLLADPSRSMTDIAMETGFSSSSLFSAQFHLLTGESPTAYRRRVAEGVNHAGPRILHGAASALLALLAEWNAAVAELAPALCRQTSCLT